MEVLSTYQHLHHVIFSLLSGRPVLVAGSGRLEPEVIKVVNALALFVPTTHRSRYAVLEWTSKPLRISDLTKLKLVGMCRPDRRSFDSHVPTAIKRACTILDLERKLIIAPPYQVSGLSSLLNTISVVYYFKAYNFYICTELTGLA